MLEGGVKKILPTMYFFGMYLLRYFMYGIRTGSDLTKAKKGFSYIWYSEIVIKST